MADQQIFKRQWGSEKRTEPLPRIHDIPSTRKIALSRFAIVLTILLWVLYVIYTAIRQFFYGHLNYGSSIEAVWYLIVVTFLMLSSLLYLITRQGAFQRFAKHVRVPRARLEQYFTSHKPAITVLVPSYSEEPQVIRKTLLSAALQEYPKIRVVLLIDDNPKTNPGPDLDKLNATRKIAKEISEILEEPQLRVNKALENWNKLSNKRKNTSNKILEDLIEEYRWSANWLNKMAKTEEYIDHVDKFFADQVLVALANELHMVADALGAALLEQSSITNKRVTQLYERLTWIFGAELDVFERKAYASLSHELNKAMNLNSYIGLMGGSYLSKPTPDGPILQPTKSKTSDIAIPDSEFLLTLDADSILLREYCLRLVYFLKQPDNSKVAVVQTPYSSFRGAKTRIERLAGATTDVQHILHQGMTYYGATFWVGANAVIRKAALDDIVEKEWVGGFEIKRYIQDRTVIEDTESSIDLTLNGWSLVNYPERLSYSATPPDFGSLIVQRRRWANGGLLILPKLWKQTKLRKQNNEVVSRMETLLRINYMASIAWASFGLIFLLAFPYNDKIISPLIVVASFPYFLAMASDLKYCGYKRSDVFRIYGFNFILLAVNIAGVIKSLQQALTGKKIPFARTPKVKDRTAASPLYILFPLLIVGFSLFILWRDYLTHNWANALFAGFNVIVTSWAVVAYIGMKNAVSDLWLHFVNWLYVEVKPKQHQVSEQNKLILDWRAVLYHGDDKQTIPLSEADYDETLSSRSVSETGVKA